MVPAHSTSTSTTGPMEMSITITKHTQRRKSLNLSSLYGQEEPHFVSINPVIKPSTSKGNPGRGQRHSHYQSIAPLSINAVLTQQAQPITSRTCLSGKSLLSTPANLWTALIIIVLYICNKFLVEKLLHTFLTKSEIMEDFWLKSNGSCGLMSCKRISRVSKLVSYFSSVHIPGSWCF